MTHGHELKGENVDGRQCAGRKGIKGGKWGNCNSIINKIYDKKGKKKKIISYLNFMCVQIAVAVICSFFLLNIKMFVFLLM